MDGLRWRRALIKPYPSFSSLFLVEPSNHSVILTSLFARHVILKQSLHLSISSDQQPTFSTSDPPPPVKLPREMLDEAGAFIQDAGVRDAIVRSGAVKFCKKCDAYKPPRAYHCPSCRKCVARMDHHCPWVNNCVGGGNLKYFLLFLFYSTISCVHYSALIFFFLMNFFRGKTPLQGNQLGAFLGVIREIYSLGLGQPGGTRLMIRIIYSGQGLHTLLNPAGAREFSSLRQGMCRFFDARTLLDCQWWQQWVALPSLASLTFVVRPPHSHDRGYYFLPVHDGGGAIWLEFLPARAGRDLD